MPIEIMPTTICGYDPPTYELQMKKPRPAARRRGPGRATARDHLGGDDHLPRDADADVHADQHRRQHAAQDQPPEDVPARGAHRARRLDQPNVDGVDAAQHVEHDRVEGAQEDHEVDRQLLGRPKDDGGGHPGQRRDGTQQLEHREDEAADRAAQRHHQPERDADGDGGQKADRHALEARGASCTSSRRREPGGPRRPGPPSARAGCRARARVVPATAPLVAPSCQMTVTTAYEISARRRARGRTVFSSCDQAGRCSRQRRRVGTGAVNALAVMRAPLARPARTPCGPRRARPRSLASGGGESPRW